MGGCFIQRTLKPIEKLLILDIRSIDMTRLQEILIQKISLTQDERILQEVNRLLETGLDEEVYQLTDGQKTGIEEAREQIQKGQRLSHEEANKEVEEWLRKR
jgi:ethanolamine utilization protein EutP (predicted NTPase)